MTAQHSGEVLHFTRGDRLRKARERTQLGQGEFADLLGVSRGLVSNYEQDKVTRPKPIVMRQWAEATGVSLTWLTWGVEHTEPPAADEPREIIGQSAALAKLTAAKMSRARHTGQYSARVA